MSVAAASGAVSTQQHLPTPEQIRLAQLIHDKKHDQPEVQDIVRKVLDVVANSSQEDALVALFDCDYDYERTVALLIEKGNDISSEWRTATNNKTAKKQQKTATTKNGLGGETNENGQQRGYDGSTYRGKSRGGSGGGGGRSRIQQQPHGGDSQTHTQQQSSHPNDNYVPQQRYRGGSGYRGRYRGSNRGTHRGNDRNYQQYQYDQQPQDLNIDNSTSSDTTAQGFTDVPYKNRRGGGKQQQLDASTWDGETTNLSKSTKDDEELIHSDNKNASNARSGILNGQSSSSVNSTLNSMSELNLQQKSQGEFDPVEATRQIKNVIGIGQLQQQQNTVPPKPLMDLKPILCDQQIGQQQKLHIIPSKPTGQNLNAKVTPPPRIPHQPVIFSDRFDGGINKIDVQFGNLSETYDERSASNASVPASSASVFYAHSESIASGTKPKTVTSSSVQNLQRPATSNLHHQSTEQSAFVSSTMHPNTMRSTDQQQQLLTQQRIVPPQMQQQQQQQTSMTMKSVVPPQYPVHHQQHQINQPNLLLQSLLFHHQPEQMQLDTSYEQTAFQLPSMDFNNSYFVAAALNQQPPQQQTQPRYMLSQPPPSQQQQQQQMSSNRQQSSANVQATKLSNSSATVSSASTSTTSSTAPKKGPAVPPGMFLPTAPPSQPGYSTVYSTPYGVAPSIGGQQQTGATAYSAPYETEHLFTNPFLQLTNVPQAQSPSGTYGSVTPPVQQQNQTHNNNDATMMNYRTPLNDNLLVLQQIQQFAIQQSNSQQQGPQAAHSPAQLNYYVGPSASGPNYATGPQIMYAQPPTAMAQQQASKQQGQQYNQTNSSSNIGGNDDYYGRGSSSSSNKEGHYMYAVSTQPQQVPPQSVGQHQGVNKQQQQQQRASGNVYNNQQNQQRPF